MSKREGRPKSTSKGIGECLTGRGENGGNVASCPNASAREQPEQQLRAAHDSFRHLVEHSPFGIYAVDADFRLVLVSDGAQKVFENVRPLIGREFAEVMRTVWAEPFASEAIAIFRHTLASGETYHAPSTVGRRGDIEAIESYDWKIERLILPDGRFGVVCHFYNLSERQTYERQLRQAAADLQAAIKAVDGIVWTNNAAGEMAGEQPGWAALTGQTLEEYSGYGWSRAVHPDDARPTAVAWQKAVEGRSTFAFEHRVRCQDGPWRIFSVRAVPIIDEPDTLRGWVGVHTDVTALRELERERLQLVEAERAARSDAELANKLKDEFLTTLSHELRTPLSVITGWCHLLQRKFGTDFEELNKGLKLIGDNAMLQARVISDLLDMSRIATGKMTLDAKRLDLEKLVAQCVLSHEPAAEAKKVTLTFEDAAQPRMVLADAARLQQVMGNLLTNALKFTPAGGTVRVATRRDQEGFAILVEDNGQGIAAEFLPRMFDRFRQADGSTARQQGGLGLGLAIVQQLIEIHGGTVRAESEGVGRGARLTVWLPEARETRPSESIDSIEQSDSWVLNPDGLEMQSLKGLRVLAVEDQSDMLEQLARVLEEHGAQVITARSAPEAIAALQTQTVPFHILLSDIGMPGMDGFELIRALRQEPKFSPERLTAVAITAFTRAEDKKRCLDAGFQAYVAKPYEASSLVALLRKLGRTHSAVSGAMKN